MINSSITTFCQFLFMSISLISMLTGEVFPVTDIMINGDQDSRVNIVFLGDGYTQEEMNDYIDDVGEVVEGLFSAVPYSNYINYFAYPFGQPIQCFNNKTNSVLIQKNVNKIFSSSGSINFDSSTILMDRIDLNQTINSKKLLMKHLMKKFIYNNIKKGFN